MEIIAIIVGVITGIGAITGASYKCYRDMRNRNIPQQEIVVHEIKVPATPPSSPVLDNIIKKAVKHHMEQYDSDTDTEIDIKIHIQTHNHEEKDDNGNGKRD